MSNWDFNKDTKNEDKAPSLNDANYKAPSLSEMPLNEETDQETHDTQASATTEPIYQSMKNAEKNIKTQEKVEFKPFIGIKPSVHKNLDPDLVEAQAKMKEMYPDYEIKNQVPARNIEGRQNPNLKSDLNSKSPSTKHPTRQEIDFSKLTEEAAYDLTIPIQAVEHSLPETMKVELKDQNYIPRWVNIHPNRLGPMRAIGYTFVETQDLARSLNLDIDEDENGQFRYIDVVLMKCLKSDYFGKLRDSYTKAQLAVDSRAAHARGKQVTEQFMNESRGSQYREARDAGKLSVYTSDTTL